MEWQQVAMRLLKSGMDDEMVGRISRSSESKLALLEKTRMDGK